ncbi:hypothetical protein M0804_015426 [Polistes exclamans]|nr:hypothetical protein M0804_015426 [Polistes exclamans]
MRKRWMNGGGDGVVALMVMVMVARTKEDKTSSFILSYTSRSLMRHMYVRTCYILTRVCVCENMCVYVRDREREIKMKKKKKKQRNKKNAPSFTGMVLYRDIQSPICQVAW